MVIDTHNHPDWHGHNLDRFLANMDKFGIDRCWLLSWECPEDEWNPKSNANLSAINDPAGPVSFSRCVSYVERAPDRFFLAYAPDPRRPQAIDKLKSAVATYGVRIYGELKLRMMFDNMDAIRMYRYCGEAGLPVVVHIDYEFDQGASYPRPNYWYGGGMEPFERAIRACPDTVFCGHGPGFWAHISGDDQYDKVVYPEGPIEPGGKLTQMMRDYPNLYCDLSAGSGRRALSRDMAHAREFVTEFHDRMLFARDCFDRELQDTLDRLELADETRRKIFGDNALGLVPLR